MSTPPYLDLPDGVRPRTVATERGEFAVLAAGASGPLALLVPGWTGSKEDYIAVLAPLAEAGYRAVALDQRGQYQSAGAGEDYTLIALGQDLLALAAAVSCTGISERDGADPAVLGAGIHLVGHSFGGLVARAATIADPGAVASLTLVCSGPAALPADRHRLLTAMADAIPALGLAATWSAKRAFERSQAAPDVPPQIEDFLRRRFLANDPVALEAMTRHLVSARDDVAALSGTGVPVLVTYGEFDDGWPPAVQREMAARLGGPAEPIVGARHSPAVERPAELTALLVRFWSEQSAHSRARPAQVGSSAE